MRKSRTMWWSMAAVVATLVSAGAAWLAIDGDGAGIEPPISPTMSEECEREAAAVASAQPGDEPPMVTEACGWTMVPEPGRVSDNDSAASVAE
jgi:hypothetical protein